MRSAIAASVFLVGCATSGIQQVGPDTYKLVKYGEGREFWLKVGGEISREAIAFCNEKGKREVTLSAYQSSNSTELHFRCV